MSDKIYIGSVRQRLEGTKCPRCNRPADGGTSLDHSEHVNQPKSGDFAICLYCGALNVYTESLQLRKIERKERRELARDPKLAELIKLTQTFAEAKRREWQ